MQTVTVKNSQWQTVFAEYLFGTSGAHCYIQKCGDKYRVTSGEKTWSYHETPREAATACAEYCDKYNEKAVKYGNFLPSCPFEALGVSR